MSIGLTGKVNSVVVGTLAMQDRVQVGRFVSGLCSVNS